VKKIISTSNVRIIYVKEQMLISFVFCSFVRSKGRGKAEEEAQNAASAFGFYVLFSFCEGKNREKVDLN
jgi:hypothetical protein